MELLPRKARKSRKISLFRAFRGLKKITNNRKFILKIQVLSKGTISSLNPPETFYPKRKFTIETVN